jgi:hypothetical protein
MSSVSLSSLSEPSTRCASTMRAMRSSMRENSSMVT